MEVLRDGSFMLNLPAEMLARGLRPSAKMARDKEYLVKCAGAVGYDNVLQVIEDLELKRIATDLAITDGFPYPQIFVCKEVIIVCGLTAIYEYHSLTPKLINIPPGLTWTCIDYGKFIYLSNCTVAVIRDAMSGVYHYADDYPTEDYRPCRAGCDNNGQAVISPCPLYVAGPTSLAPTSLPPTTIIPVPTSLLLTTLAPSVYDPWWSCPQTVIYGNGTDDIFFATTNNNFPNTLFTVHRYNRLSGDWTLIYSIYNPPSAIYDGFTFDFWWQEPQISKASLGNITVFGLVRQFDNGTSSPPTGLDIFVFNGEALVSNYQISPAATYSSIIPFYASHWIAMDSTGLIHVLKADWKNPNTKYIDYISNDNGVSFTPVEIATIASYNYHQYLITDLSDNLWALISGNKVYKSTNHGASWSFIGTTPTVASDFAFLNDALFVIRSFNNQYLIYRSTDGIAWSNVLTVATTYALCGALAFDGTYYYAIFNNRNSSGQVAGVNHVYRSDDGITWSEIASFADNTEFDSVGADGVTTDISVHDGKLVYTYYYAETLLSGQPTVYMLTVWESVDNGVTWTPIQTPFYDLSTGTAPI